MRETTVNVSVAVSQAYDMINDTGSQVWLTLFWEEEGGFRLCQRPGFVGAMAFKLSLKDTKVRMFEIRQERQPR